MCSNLNSVLGRVGLKCIIEEAHYVTFPLPFGATGWVGKVPPAIKEFLSPPFLVQASSLPIYAQSCLAKKLECFFFFFFGGGGGVAVG